MPYKETECFLKGGHCVGEEEEEYCFNSIKSMGLCGDYEKQM